MLSGAALLVTALLFGGMLLYSFGFAAFLFSSLPPQEAGPLLRRAFPLFYLWVIVTSLLAAALAWAMDPLGMVLLLAIAGTTLPVRQLLMPAINAATDAGHSRRFNLLHGLSVLIGLLQIAAAAWALLRIAG